MHNTTKQILILIAVCFAATFFTGGCLSVSSASEIAETDTAPLFTQESQITPAPPLETGDHTPYDIVSRPTVQFIITTPSPRATHAPSPETTTSPAPFPAPLQSDFIVQLTPPEPIPDDERYIHILLAGVDRRSNKGNSRADTIMIGTLDLEHGVIKLTSILRDTLVYIPDPVDKKRKINAASSQGGMQLLMETINYNFGMNIDSYVMIDFEMFQRLVDNMGGVSLELTAKEISAANDCIAGLNKQTGCDLRDGFILSEPGLIKLTGKQALGFVRIRKIDSDFKRTERQFELLEAAFSQFCELPLTTQYSVLYGAFPYVSTNISAGRMVGIALKALEVGLGDMRHFRIPVSGMYKSGTYNGSYALLADLDENSAALHSFILEE